MSLVTELGHRSAFRLGSLHIHPARCEIQAGESLISVEPRVMQVLLQLTDAGGGTVTRSDLVEHSWEGRFVSDDAINRVMARLRRVIEDHASGTLELNTVRKVGYRLVATDPATSPISIVENAAISEAAPPNKSAASIAKSPIISVRWLGAVLALGCAAVALFAFTTQGDSQSLIDLEPEGYNTAANDLSMRGAAAVFEQTPAQVQQAVHYFRAALAKEPRNPTLWGSLGLAYGFSARSVPPEEQADIVDRARQASDRGLALDPSDGHALAAMLLATSGYGNWTARDADVRSRLAKSNGHSPAPIFQLARFEAAVGRNAAALAADEQAWNKHPLVPWINTLRIQMLAANERQIEAEQAADEAARLWPRNAELWRARYFMLLFGGAADQAWQMTQDRKNWYASARPQEMELLERLAEASTRDDKPKLATILADLERQSGEGQGYLEVSMRVAAFIGDKERAIRLMDQLLSGNTSSVRWRFTDYDEYALAGERPTAALFQPPMNRVWHDPRFAAAMERIGLVAYWRDTDAPDLCKFASPPIFCRTLTTKQAEEVT